jgi:hypothetical protein
MKPILNLMVIGGLVIAIITCPVNGMVDKNKKQEQSIVEVLKKFQAGYTQRDVTKVDEFVNELFDSEDVFLVGTDAASVEHGEWGEGIEKVKEVVERDWKYWGDLKLDIDTARIRIHANTAWVALWASSEKLRPKKEEYKKTVERIMRALESNKDKFDSRLILHWLINFSSRYLWEFEQGEEFIHPLRITAVLVKKKGKWLFRQIHFSFPMRGMPVYRIFKDQEEK